MLLSVLQQDDASFERHFAQLKPYYTDARCEVHYLFVSLTALF